ncbi:hypothetical protein [Inediibacterium massiliense]|uniref:hypothetical protein n=1 Tax=Inediibacterium massiliense TaxID=1658111 RepID=UPI0006B60EE4|nr:hypothetical protein [Inediibacterium massiliense]
MEEVKTDIEVKKDRVKSMGWEDFIPIALFALLAKEEKENGNINLSKELKIGLQKAENIVNLLYDLHDYVGEDDTYLALEMIKSRPFEVLQVIRPHIQGKGKHKIDQALAVHDQMNRLQKNSSQNPIEKFEQVTNILEILEIEQGHELKQMIQKTKHIMNILRQ